MVSAAPMAALDSVLHRRRTDPRIGEWLEKAEAADEIAERDGLAGLIGEGQVKRERIAEFLIDANAFEITWQLIGGQLGDRRRGQGERDDDAEDHRA